MKKLLIIALSIFVLSLLLVTVVKANPTYFAASKYLTEMATTTKATLNPTGTTSFVFDSFDNGNNQKVDELVLLTQHISSTSAAVLTTSLTFSHDGVDYFSDTYVASTSPAVYMNTAATYITSANAVSSTTRTTLRINVPTRYLKVTFTGTTATSTIWAQLVPAKEAK